MKKTMIMGLATFLSLAVTAPALAVTTNATSTLDVHMTTGVHNEQVKKTLQGTIKETSTNSFVLTVRNTDYSVTTMISTRIVNRVWKKIALSNIKVGDKVRVYGAIAGTNIAAEIVRDISVPTPSKASRHATTTPTH